MRAIRAVTDYLNSFLRSDDQYQAATSPSQNQRWNTFSRWTVIGAFGSVALLFLAVFILNPFGNFPITPLSQVFADHNQRYTYPSIARSGRHQSAIFGTSSSRLLTPQDLENEFGGKFANLSMDASTAWEQTQLARLFLRQVEKPETVILSLDWMVWCNQAADEQRVTFRLFPKTFYDENPINDFADILNLELWDALRKSVKVATGSRQPYQDADGFGDFTPGEDNYDAERAYAHIHEKPIPQPDLTPLTPEELANLKFPALDWLAVTLSEIPDDTKTLIVRMPVNVTALAVPGTRNEQAEKECFRRTKELAGARGIPIFDMAFASPFTTNDLNYWDPMHYRLPLGAQIVRAIGRAYRDGQSTDILQVTAAQK
ncbi:hypothetical protein HGG72_08505 [Ochrobactrum pecoris]|uniref:Uncharacterized protein n=1 Tax=Brucella pecoris TaxID=867683 RepID=A0A5C5CU95_9HYPH|nr:hypothetical protein [Brucella pecoris]MBB4092468.1 hypothetical protein [Brucella pecoris]NKW80378.1 hypothetical protein [Brucella pecoris]TNV14306.1 hypothetical protein FIB18_03450 [Brucella pecoris]